MVMQIISGASTESSDRALRIHNIGGVLVSTTSLDVLGMAP